jgi:hypothetical protein
MVNLTGDIIMGTKLGRKTLPSGHGPGDFKYMGRPAKDQGDFGDDVGIVDCACVNQFGDSNNSKFYHGGVVQSSNTSGWFVYLQWGRISGSGESWQSDSFVTGMGDYQFYQAGDENDARAFFAKQLASKNTKRLVQKDVGGTTIWAGKAGKDGYIVQSLATRTRGLPDAYSIKDSTGVATTTTKKKTVKKATKSLSRTYHPAELALAKALIGGTQDYTRSLSKASGVVPTMSAIDKVRDDLIPAALVRCAAVGNDVAAQLRDGDLKAISKMVFAMVPQHIPRTGLTPENAILNAGNILKIQQDLDAFESALKGEDFTVETTKAPQLDPDTALNAQITYIDPKSEHGAWVANTYRNMTNNRHGDLGRQKLKILNMFAVTRPDRDARFMAATKALAASRSRLANDVKAGLQPSKRPDMAELGDYAAQANVFVGIHGTRGVNVAPILGSHLRLPKSLAGVHITGAAFGHGIYFATDLKKSWGYTGRSYRWGGGGGSLSNRGAFMFLCDVAGGQFHYPRSAWSINGDKCPGGGDSVYAHPSKIGSLANDEHVIFNADHCRIRYIVEMDFS